MNVYEEELISQQPTFQTSEVGTTHFRQPIGLACVFEKALHILMVVILK